MNLFERSFQKVLPRSFYLKKTLEVARLLLGKGLLVHPHQGDPLAEQILAVQITEVEAYLGTGDPASHSFAGQTKRNQSMFESGGTCYVYLSYGMHYCMNVVTGKYGVGEAVLIRAAVPLVGYSTFMKNRGDCETRNLMNGPGKLAQALGINLDFDGARFDGDRIQIVDLGVKPNRIQPSPRIGISKGQELLYRFQIELDEDPPQGGVQ